MPNYKRLFAYFLFLTFTILVLFYPYMVRENKEVPSGNALRIMTYSSFLQEWGAGPDLAKAFKKETGIDVQWINAGNAGLIIERLKFNREKDRPDLIIGFDQFSIYEARDAFKWKDVRDVNSDVQSPLLPRGASFHDFLAYDWGPLTFVYKKGEVEPPKKLQDLVDKRFKGKLILQDPRMSSPGLQFLLWVINEMGEEEGFEFLKKLAPSIKVMAPSWSSSYSIFKVEQPSLVFSYFTSPFFHKVEENDESYVAAVLENSHPVQVEYAGIPEFCGNCEAAQQFVRFMLEKSSQQVLMKKNYMYPVEGQALEGSAFELPMNVNYLQPFENQTYIKNKRKLVNQWKKVFY